MTPGSDGVASGVEPDTKDWTWVLDRNCPSCGFDAAAMSHTDVATRIRRDADDWVSRLSEAAVTTRPATVGDELRQAAGAVADIYQAVPDDSWSRRGLRSNGSEYDRALPPTRRRAPRLGRHSRPLSSLTTLNTCRKYVQHACRTRSDSDGVSRTAHSHRRDVAQTGPRASSASPRSPRPRACPAAPCTTPSVAAIRRSQPSWITSRHRSSR